MVENIPQATYMDTSQWPKDMHLGYAKNVIRRIDEAGQREKHHRREPSLFGFSRLDVVAAH